MLEATLVALAGFVGGFVSTLASTGSSITLPALEVFGLSEHAANGTNRLSVVALGFVGSAVFFREGLSTGARVHASPPSSPWGRSWARTSPSG